MEKQLTVKDIMTKNVVTAFEDEPLIEVARRIYEKDYNGLPIIDINKKVVGIITQYDLISKGTSIHIPTFVKLLKKLPILKQEKSKFKKEIEPILELRVKDVINKDPIVVKEDESIEGLAGIFSAHHRVNPIPVVNKKGELTGIVSRHDLIKFLAGPSKTPDSALKSIDTQIKDFVDSFEKRFTIVTKARARHWVFLSLLFAVAGFLIALALILRVLG